MSDTINKPAHYVAGRTIEPCDAIIDWGLSYCLGQVVRYVSRAGRKDPSKTVEDLSKARWYLDREIARLGAASPAAPVAIDAAHPGKDPGQGAILADPVIVHTAAGPKRFADLTDEQRDKVRADLVAEQAQRKAWAFERGITTPPWGRLWPPADCEDLDKRIAREKKKRGSR